MDSSNDGGRPQLPKPQARNAADFLMRFSGFGALMGLVLVILASPSSGVRTFGFALIIATTLTFVTATGYVTGFDAGTVWGRTPGSLEADLAVKEEEDRDQ